MKYEVKESKEFSPIIITLRIETKEELEIVINDLGNTGNWSDVLYGELNRLIQINKEV